MQNSLPKVFVIVLNFNGKKTLPGCLATIFQSDYQNFEVVLVDNNSTDGSFEQAKDAYSRVHFIRNSANIGFAKGNNVAIRFALEKFADYVFILNNDTLLEKNTLTELVKQAENNPAAALYSPLILNPGKMSAWFAGGKINWLKMQTQHLTLKKTDTPYASEYLSGCALLVPKVVFQKIGLFDERYFLYYEDADFSLRAKKAGFELLLVPTAQLEHLEQSNTENPLKTYWLVISALLFFRTHGSLAQKIWYFFYVPARRLKNLLDLIFAKTPLVVQVAKAYRDYGKYSH